MAWAIGLMLVACRGPSSLGAGPLPQPHPTDTFEANEFSAPEAGSVRPMEVAAPMLRGGACNDGVDNDGDGFVDWQLDPGCFGPDDPDETSGPRSEEDGFTTFDVLPGSRIIYVSSSVGDDSRAGTSPEHPVRTLAHAASLVRSGEPDFLLLKRGDTWHAETLEEFKSGKSPSERLVVSSYGDSSSRPRVLIDKHFINHNGKTRSFLAIVGIEVVPFRKIPGNPQWDGNQGGGLRFVGGGSDILVEDCHVLFSKFLVQSYGGNEYRNVEIRRSIIERAYHVGTCTRKPTHRPAGLFSADVTNLVVEENLFDHNGWSEDVPDACATMYNQNLYLNAQHGLVVRGNLIVRASSIGLKLTSVRAGNFVGAIIEENFFAEGEIGVSVGGNSVGPHRFQDIVIRNNVFSQVGVTAPTSRSLAWGIDVMDNQRSLVEGNLFTSFAAVGNSFGVRLGGSAEEDVNVRNNRFHGFHGRPITTSATDDFIRVSYDRNVITGTAPDACVIAHGGPLGGTRYRGGEYESASEPSWFCVDGQRMNREAWGRASGEQARAFVGAPEESGRTIGTYAASLDLGQDLVAFLAAAKLQSRLSWDTRFTARAVNAYLRAGFR